MRYPLKLIEWRDAFNGDHAWFHTDQLPDKPPTLIVQTIGFEVRRDEDHVTLAMSHTSADQLCDLFTIPLAIVLREQTFRSRLT